MNYSDYSINCGIYGVYDQILMKVSSLQLELTLAMWYLPNYYDSEQCCALR